MEKTKKKFIIKLIVAFVLGILAFALGYCYNPRNVFHDREVMALSFSLFYATIFVLACVWFSEKRWILASGLTLTWVLLISIRFIFFHSGYDPRVYLSLSLFLTSPIMALLGCFWKPARKWGLLAALTFTEIIVFLITIFYF